jgi:hypothetical protein
LVVVAACSSGGDEKAAPTTTAPTTAAASQTSTETAPEPITAEEERWVPRLSKLKKKLEKVAFRGGVITRARLLSEAKVYRMCRKRLGTLPSERFRPAYRAAVKACRQFGNAATQSAKAAGLLGIGGGVEAGTPQERAFERALDRTIEAAGNGVNTMLRAVEKAQEIRATLPT